MTFNLNNGVSIHNAVSTRRFSHGDFLNVCVIDRNFNIDKKNKNKIKIETTSREEIVYVTENYVQSRNANKMEIRST